MPAAQPTVVVGGGICGLALALSLRRGGAQVTLLEASEAPGGTARTLLRDGFLLETGPNSVLDRDGAVAALAASVGLPLRLASESARQRAIVLGGRVRTLPSSPLAFLASDVLTLSAKARLLLEPLSRRAPEGVDESLGDFARRHLGRTVTSTLVDALQTGIWAGDIEKLSAASAFPRLKALEDAHRSLLLGALRTRAGAGTPRPVSFEGGLGGLSTALARALGARMHLSSRATALARTADGWTVTTPEGRLGAAQVVLALPPWDAAALVRPFDAVLAEGLLGFASVAVAVVHLGYSPAPKPAPDGFGFLVPTAEGRDILGTVYASSLFPFRAPADATLLTVLLGGAHKGNLLALDDAALVQTARRELLGLLRIQQEPTLTHVVRWPRAIPQHDVGYARRLQDVLGRAARWPGLWLLGNAYGGASVPDCIRSASELSRRLHAG
jgi:protoporphyrinogen/coproporphyrinogen III oxidase